MAKPLILLTNDDGIHSPGLHAIIAAIAGLGDIVIVAPKSQQTSMGRAIRREGDKTMIEPVTLPVSDHEYTAFAINGSPALAAAYGTLVVAPRMPDLCISGINYGENIGATITTSGTIGAALEAASLGVPGLAMSLEVPADISHGGEYVDLDWATAGHFTRVFAERILREGMIPGAEILNVNVPAAATPTTPTRLTKQSTHLYYQWTIPEERILSPLPRLRKYILPPGDGEWDENDDVTAFRRDGVVSVTPLSGNLTANIAQGSWLDHLS